MRLQWQSKHLFQLVVAVLFIGVAAIIALQFYAKPYDDLPSFYWATQLAFDKGLSAYEPQHFQALGLSLDRKIYPFLYPPPSLLIFSPFLLGDYEQCKIFVTVFNVLLWCLLAGMSYRLYCFYAGCERNYFASLLIPLWLLIFVPVFDVLRTGQVDLFVLICLMPLFFQKQERWQQIGGGVLLALAIILKVYLLLLLPVLMIMRAWRWLIATVVFLVAMIVLSLCVLPQQLWLDWLTLSQQSSGFGKLIPHLMTIPWNQSINGFFIRQFLNEGILSGLTNWVWVIYVCSVSVLSISFFLILGFLRKMPQSLSIAAALTLLTILIIAPLTWLHHFVFALPIIIFCLATFSHPLQKLYQTLLFILLLVSAGIMSLPFLTNLIFPALAVQQIRDNTISLGFNLLLSTELLAAMGIFVTFLFVIADKIQRINPH